MKYNMNFKYYDRTFQAPSQKWWRSLSINEQRGLEEKYATIYDMAMASEIAAMHEVEVLRKHPGKSLVEIFHTSD